jgi:predicted RNase H-like HicB family nuclease
LEPAEPTGYAVMVPALPGAFSYGATVEEAMANAREAIALHIEGLRSGGLPVPPESPARLRRPQRLHVQVPAEACHDHP